MNRKGPVKDVRALCSPTLGKKHREHNLEVHLETEASKAILGREWREFV